MIRNNLSTLFSERGLKATRVSAETGIARSTLSSLTQNDSKMIQLETINTLCMYLGIGHEEFFSFIPYDFEYDLYLNEINIERVQHSVFSTDDYLKIITFDLFITVKTADGKIVYNAEGESTNDVSLMKSNADMFVSYKIIDETFNQFWSENIPTSFKTDILKQMNDFISEEIKKQLIAQFEELDIDDLTRYNNIRNSLEYLYIQPKTRIRGF